MARSVVLVLCTACAVSALACGGAEVGVPLPFDGSQVAPGGEAVRLAVGARPCELPARSAVVVEGDRRVEIRLFGQELAPDTVCTEVLAAACFEVPLETPLGGREVVDVSGREASLGQEGTLLALRGTCVRVPARG